MLGLRSKMQARHPWPPSPARQRPSNLNRAAARPRRRRQRPAGGAALRAKAAGRRRWRGLFYDGFIIVWLLNVVCGKGRQKQSKASGEVGRTAGKWCDAGALLAWTGWLCSWRRRMRPAVQRSQALQRMGTPARGPNGAARRGAPGGEAGGACWASGPMPCPTPPLSRYHSTALFTSQLHTQVRKAEAARGSQCQGARGPAGAGTAACPSRAGGSTRRGAVRHPAPTRGRPARAPPRAAPRRSGSRSAPAPPRAPWLHSPPAAACSRAAAGGTVVGGGVQAGAARLAAAPRIGGSSTVAPGGSG